MSALFRLRTLLPLAAAAAVVACGGDSAPAPVIPPPSTPLALATQTVLDTSAGLQQPIDLQPAPGDTRLFIAERAGQLRIVENGMLRTTAFLDISSRVSPVTEGERGLLSFAFHPQYATTQPFVYVHYTEAGTGDILVDRYRPLPGNLDRLDPTSRIEVIRIAHRQASNHNGGRVAFGPDGMLYLSTGDGGGGNDQFGNGQNTATLLGKLLRLDTSVVPYRIPTDNPTWGGGSALRENWAIGLRNPWRFAFDGNQLYIADVGQGALEEINAVSAASAGLNYGWSIQEGSACFNPATGCDRTGLTQPVSEYSHTQGCSIIGGYVYRGNAIPELQGRYLYSDFCRGFVRSLRLVNGAATELREWIASVATNSVLSFGIDAAGELYLLLSDGRVLKLVRA